MELYIKTIQAICHIEQHNMLNPNSPITEDMYAFAWKYWTTGIFDFNTPNSIHCGDILTTDEHGKILTVNGKEYVHVN
jgi:hypothetical protein